MRGYEREQTRKELMDHKLAASLKVLIRHEPLEKITIKQITDDAGVVRPTFYQHFADKYRLIEWILQKELLLPAEPLLMQGEMPDAVLMYAKKVWESGVFYKRTVMSAEGRLVVQRYLQSYFKEIVIQRSMGTRMENPDISAECFGQSMAFWLIQFMEHGEQNAVELECLNYIAHSMESMFNVRNKSA